MYEPGTGDETRRATLSLALGLMIALGTIASPRAYAQSDMDTVLIQAGQAHYEQFCMPCHGTAGAPGEAVYKASGEPVDLRTYVERNDGKFPTAKWLALLADANPGNLHAAVWETIRKRQGETSAGSALSRGVIGQIARYVNSVQAK